MNEGTGTLAEIEEEVTEGETLEDLLRSAIDAVKKVGLLILGGFGMVLVCLALMATAVYVIHRDNEHDKTQACRRGNERAADLVLLVDKVQEVAGGPGASAKVDELAEFGHAQFVQRDCNGDGDITDADRPAP